MVLGGLALLQPRKDSIDLQRVEEAAVAAVHRVGVTLQHEPHRLVRQRRKAFVHRRRTKRHELRVAVPVRLDDAARHPVAGRVVHDDCAARHAAHRTGLQREVGHRLLDHRDAVRVRRPLDRHPRVVLTQALEVVAAHLRGGVARVPLVDVPAARLVRVQPAQHALDGQPGGAVCGAQREHPDDAEAARVLGVRAKLHECGVHRVVGGENAAAHAVRARDGMPWERPRRVHDDGVAVHAALGVQGEVGDVHVDRRDALEVGGVGGSPRVDGQPADVVAARRHVAVARAVGGARVARVDVQARRRVVRQAGQQPAKPDAARRARL